jgi:hypothetical protein
MRGHFPEKRRYALQSLDTVIQTHFDYIFTPTATKSIPKVHSPAKSAIKRHPDAHCFKHASHPSSMDGASVGPKWPGRDKLTLICLLSLDSSYRITQHPEYLLNATIAIPHIYFSFIDSRNAHRIMPNIAIEANRIETTSISTPRKNPSVWPPDSPLDPVSIREIRRLHAHEQQFIHQTDQNSFAAHWAHAIWGGCSFAMAFPDIAAAQNTSLGRIDRLASKAEKRRSSSGRRRVFQDQPK